MKEFKFTAIVLLLGTFFFNVSVGAKSPGILLQEGLYAEETEGNLDKAIEIYKQIVEDTGAYQRIAARALYQLGKCHLKKGQEHEAIKYFKELVDGYPTQKAIVKQAKEQLSKFKPTPEKVVEKAVQKQGSLQEMIDSAEVGSVLVVPDGRYTKPVKVNKSLTLKGQSRQGCIFEITADEPAILIDTGGKGGVTIENMTIKWQLATSNKGIEYPCAVAAKDSKAEINGCAFIPLGNPQRSPVAARAKGFSKLAVKRCRFEGFEYVICFDEGTNGSVEDSLIMNCGHQGVMLYSRSKVSVSRNVITGSNFHAVRSTGGTLDMQDNLIIDNKNRGVYLGNKSAAGTIKNNVIKGNSVGISGFSKSRVQIENNVIMDSTFAGIAMEQSCSLTIRNNILCGNDKGWVMFEKGGMGGNTCYRNTFWKNKIDAENFSKTGNSILEDPRFVSVGKGDFSLQAGPAKENKQGLTNPEVFKKLWKIWQNRKNENEPFGSVGGAASVGNDRQATPQRAVESFLSHVTSGSSKAKFFIDSGSALIHQLDDLAEVFKDQKFAVESVHSDNAAALVITSPIKTDGRFGQLVFTLDKQRQLWFVNDVDLEDPEGTKGEIKRFLEDHTSAEIHLPACRVEE